MFLLCMDLSRQQPRGMGDQGFAEVNKFDETRENIIHFYLLPFNKKCSFNNKYTSVFSIYSYSS